MAASSAPTEERTASGTELSAYNPVHKLNPIPTIRSKQTHQPPFHVGGALQQHHVDSKKESNKTNTHLREPKFNTAKEQDSIRMQQQPAARLHLTRKYATISSKLGAPTNYYIKTKIAKDPRGTLEFDPAEQTSSCITPTPYTKIDSTKGHTTGCRPKHYLQQEW
ncbi:hypothetical protein Nepgr_033632 [Nepenthes gracilis]|uniref:Uncharacterized protein n=1 Tax=Nepenthes gracilis TaxID=150966 RepID=A0AAD3TKZ4_NEPGR|nr:hypothetical protein Nepgr_033632 [Nepenthes gracilis]